MDIVLDDIDIKILNYLQQNAKLNHKEIGDKLFKAPTTIYNRISRLEKAGLVKGYVAILDQEKILHGQTVYTHVQLKNHSQDTFELFEDSINAMPEVMECYHSSGDYDFLLRIVTRDMKAYHRFLTTVLFNTGLIAKTDTTVIMREAKKVTAYALRLDQLQA
jgi:Lrp/AsnC family leucine-responsive transcriptional regulator